MIADTLLARAVQIPGLKRLWTKFPIGSIALRTRFDIWKRPHYAYGVYAAADLAKRLGLPAISVIECGVAGGRGLLELERVAQDVGGYFGIHISVFGFDRGEGMPEPSDYRDLPHIWAKGYYRMDSERLKGALKSASLILGDLENTIPSFFKDNTIDPIGFVVFDVDYYSSTMKAFQLLEADYASHLPRVYCYFDDTIWPEIACHNEYTGELCAIRDFNLKYESKKLCPIHKLKTARIHPSVWNDQMYVFHDFQHPLYCTNLQSTRDTKLSL